MTGSGLETHPDVLEVHSDVRDVLSNVRERSRDPSG